VTTFSAPGKLFLIGEYAVLHGATAVVTAVDRRVVARFVPGARPSSPLIAEAVKAVALHASLREAAMPDGAPEVDSSALSQDGQKLGLGSSAAAVVAAIAALWDALGTPLDDDSRGRDFLLSIASRAHRQAQGGRGSGGDVAAAVLGGVISYAKGGRDNPVVKPLPEVIPAELVVFRAGDPAATVHFLNAVERLEARDEFEHAALVAPISEAAEAFIEAYEAGDRSGLIAAVDAAHQALDALGNAADVPIVTPSLQTAAALARGCGGAAKGSGAGGGDVGVGFFPDRDAADAFRARAAKLGLEILSIKTGARGLSRDG
jgi:phosphomevalonate kinase